MNLLLANTLSYPAYVDDMNRRTFLQSLAPIAISASSGCLAMNPDGSDSPNATSEPTSSSTATKPATAVADIKTYRPPDGMALDYLTSSPTENPRKRPRSLADFDPVAQRELVITIARGTYSGKGNADFDLWDSDVTNPVIAIGGTNFKIGRRTGHHSSENVERYDPFKLEASIDSGDLTIELTNTSEEEYEITYLGQPYHGVLVAWDGQAHFLGNSNYASNDLIGSSGEFVYTGVENTSTPMRHPLDSGESVQDTYSVPDEVEDGTTIWLNTDFVVDPPEGRENPLLKTYQWVLTLTR